MAEKKIRIPDIGEGDDVSVIEVLVSAGDAVEVDQSLITLESDKASMEVPSTVAGKVKSLEVAVGDSVAEGDVVAVIEVAGDDEADEDDGETSKDAKDDAKSEKDEKDKAPKRSKDTAKSEEDDKDEKPKRSEGDGESEKDEKDEKPKRSKDDADDAGDAAPSRDDDRPAAGSAGKAVSDQSVDAAYASPSVRALARELGVDLGRVTGTGRKGRITRDDLAAFVKQALSSGGGAAAGQPAGVLPPMPEIDFSKFGEVETVALSRIRRRAATNLHRAWLHVPHVTQHEDADVTDTETFRKAHNDRVKQAGTGTKLSPVAYVLKAAAAALKAFPEVNASLTPDGEGLVLKKYIHLGVAVDTEDGLIVPVIRDVDRKGLEAVAVELGDIAGRARDRKLKPEDLKGASFTVSSLGGIGGTAFTPIVNAPEVAILGVSKAAMKPVWQDGDFVPRLILPLSLSYDHRVVDGAMAARFIVHLADLLGDLRRLLL